MTRVLIVEDDHGTLKALRKCLERFECEIMTSTNPLRAIEFAADFEPQLLISDWDLNHRTDGVALARTISASVNDVRIIFITGLSTQRLADKTRDLNVHCILKKPFGIAAITSAVESVLNIEPKKKEKIT